MLYLTYLNSVKIEDSPHTNHFHEICYFQKSPNFLSSLFLVYFINFVTTTATTFQIDFKDKRGQSALWHPRLDIISQNRNHWWQLSASYLSLPDLLPSTIRYFVCVFSPWPRHHATHTSVLVVSDTLLLIPKEVRVCYELVKLWLFYLCACFLGIHLYCYYRGLF